MPTYINKTLWHCRLVLASYSGGDPEIVHPTVSHKLEVHCFSTEALQIGYAGGDPEIVHAPGPPAHIVFPQSLNLDLISWCLF